MDVISEKIRDNYEQLTPQEKKLADFLLSHPDNLPLFNSTDLASTCEISKATISRLFKRFGYTSFKEARHVAQKERHQGTPFFKSQSSGALHNQHFEQEIKNLQYLQNTLTNETVDRAAEHIGNAKNVVVIGFRNSYPIAVHCRQQLVQIRSNVSLAPVSGQTIGEELANLSPDDLVILIGFRRRPTLIQPLIAQLKTLSIPTLLISDFSLRQQAKQVDVWIECPLESASSFNSYSAAMSLIALLANKTLDFCADDAQLHIDKVTAFYKALEEVDFS